MDMSKVAAQMYTIREYCYDYETLDQSMAKLKEIGYQAVQISGVSGVTDEEIKELADKHGLTICGTHVWLVPFDLEAVVKQHEIYGCKYVGQGAMPEENRKSKETYLEFMAEFNKISKALAERGLQFIYHNHDFEFERFGDKIGMDIMFDEAVPEFGFEVDTYWVQSGGGNPVKWIRKMEGKMKVVHFKDMAIVDGKQVFAEIGHGNLDWKEIIQACEDIGVEWYCIEQDTCPGDPFESLKKSFDYLASLEV